MASSLETYIIETTPARVVERYRSLVHVAQTTDFGELDRDVVVIDTETTGVSFNHDELTQIAAARMRDGKVVDWFVTFVNPGMAIPDDIVHLTKITQDDVRDAPSPEEACAALAEFVGDSDLVAHNANFDKHFCTKNEGGAPLADNLWIDSLDLARISVPRLKSHRLTDLVRAFDAPISTHRADADVEALCAVYRILLAGISLMPPSVVSAIARFCPRSEWPTVKIFQHFAGVSDEDTPAEELNLRKLRYNNVNTNPRAARPDAAMLAQDPAHELSFASNQQINECFMPGGLVSHMYPGFELRREQLQMARAVNDAFANSENLAVEAGTGVGKSMAYLVPAALTAKINGITVGVATKTNALLDQLINHELPALSAACGGLTYSALKGFSHYPCLRRVERLLASGPRMRQVNDQQMTQAPALAGLLSFIEQTDYDDIDGLKIDFRVLPKREISTTSHECLRRKCPFFGTRCYVHGSRLRAEASDIVVTNQSLLFCDVAAEGGLLPPIRYWVVDEAHGAENEARRAFSYTVDVAEIQAIVSRVHSSEHSRSVFMRAEAQLAGKVELKDDKTANLLSKEECRELANDGMDGGDTLLFALTAKAKSAAASFASAAEDFCQGIHGLSYFDTQSNPNYDFSELWLNDQIRSSSVFGELVTRGRIMCESAGKLINASQNLVALLDETPIAATIQREIASVALRLKELVNACEILLFQCPETYAYAAKLVKRKTGWQRGSENLQALMLSVGEQMNETLLATTHSMIFTSATMTIDGSFENFTQSIGLNAAEGSRTKLLALPPGYDFDSQMTIYVANDIPEPSEPQYLAVLTRFLVDLHRAQQGSTLSLFTNRREMEKCYEVVRDELKVDDLRVVCQKWGVSVKGLRDDFVNDEHLSLFALKSFWEGFDAPGATLKAVVIPKLPFSKPSDPLSCARAERDQNAWRHYVLPAAVMETRQAAGRLIRNANDTGNLILADRRLVTKGYGKVFLNSMPSKNIKVIPMQAICREIASKQ